ncbi:MAG TPA: hypothetical protein VHE30_04685 [Polyangiaceae bacterium]|nr:hypothetical protein [Polyangiaceae bacterium]
MTGRGRGGTLAVLCAAAFLVASCLVRTASAGDPYLRYYTVHSPHFRVHYHAGLEDLAQRTAVLAEAIRARLGAALEHVPDTVVHILVVDTTDSANGSASGVPYNAVRVFVTPPEDQSTLGDYDDWMTELVTHENTHIVHIDTLSSFPWLLNRILGRTYAPNQVQPHWVLEGLAVAMESRLTSGGRLRSSIFDMYLRADVLEGNLAGLDEMSHDVRRWPGGDIWYLYGGKFIGWIHEQYGPDVFAAVAQDYGENVFPWGLNRSIFHATGRTYPELYDGWVATLREKYGKQRASVIARGLREGTRLTHEGDTATSPRFVPPCARKGKREELVYYRDNAHDLPGLYRVPLESRSVANEADAELVARAAGSPRNVSFDAECGMVFDSVAPSVRRRFFDDLHYQPLGTTSPFGHRGSRERWTTSLRARSPDVSPDGRRIVFSQNHAGTLTLRIADVRPEGGIEHVRALVPSAAGEAAFSPRFSPDGLKVAYSAWTRGGYRDVRVVDVKSGRFFDVTHDRAHDAQPTWTPDGRYVVWSSDRTGIANLYAYELSTGRISQVTNVVNGAYMPELAADGRTVFYVGYTSAGYDLFSMPFDERRFLPALPPPDDRPEPPPEPPRVRYPVTTYDPWDTMRPFAYALDVGPGTWGEGISARVSGSDIAGLHSFGASLNYQPTAVTGAVSYAYNGLPASLTLSGVRSIFPRAPILVGGAPVAVRDEAISLNTGVSYSMPGEFDGQTVSLTYSAAEHQARYSTSLVLDPYTVSRARPDTSFQGSIRAGWRYSSVFRPLFGVSPERGFTLAVAASYQSPATLSSATLATFEGRFTGYLRAPWLEHHVFAVSLAGGSASGDYARGFYSTGGFIDTQDLYDSITNALYQSSVVIRGYRPGAFFGRQYNLGTLEYRFPFAWNRHDVGWIDRGVSTLPFFLHGFWGTLFADYGGAYDVIDPRDALRPFHLGVGAELYVSFTLGYFLNSTLRLGYAKGLSDGAIPGSQTYVVLAASF